MTNIIENYLIPIANYYLVFIQEHLVVFNIIEFVLMGLDKSLALLQQYRIPEICLLFFGFLGPFGGWTGMVIFNHKISSGKLYFQILMLCCTALHFYLVPGVGFLPFGGWTVMVIFNHKISSGKLWLQFLLFTFSCTALYFYLRYFYLVPGVYDS